MSTTNSAGWDAGTDMHPDVAAQEQRDLDREEQTAHDQVATAIERVRSDVTAFDKIEAGIARLQEQYPADLVVDVTTTAGMKEAVQARAAWRDPRVNLERVRKSAKAPVLELGRKIDALAADIEARLRIGEEHYDGQIKAEEQRKAAAKKEAEEREAARVKQIQGRIAFYFSTAPVLMTGKTSSEIGAKLREIAALEVTDVEFEEFAQEALNAKQAAELQLIAMRDAARLREQEAEQARTVAEENRRKQEELQRQQEAFEAEKRAERARIMEEQREREALAERERLARAAELEKIEQLRAALARERQAEEDRKAAAERARLDAEAAEARRIADEQAAAERERIMAEHEANAAAVRKANEEADKKRAAEEAKQRRAAKKLAQVQKCGPRLLAAVKGVLPFAIDANHGGPDLIAAVQEARDAIAEAEAE